MGEGIFDKVVNLFGDQKNNLYPGEKHVPLYTKKGFKMANYMGPGTNLLERLKRGDAGVSDADRTAIVHDIEYTLASNPRDVTNADLRMLKNLDKIQKRGSDYRINIEAGRKGIQGKLMGEKIGFLEKGSFSGKTGGKDLSAQDKKLLLENLKSMTQKGYGNKIHKPRALYGNEINYMMKEIPHFAGVYAQDELKNIKTDKNKNMCLVYNLNKRHESGSHWVCINYNKNDKKIEHFDSFGVFPTTEAIKLMNKYKLPIHYQNKKLQKTNSILCGFFCIEYLKQRLHNSINDVLNSFTQKPSLYNEMKVLDDSF